MSVSPAHHANRTEADLRVAPVITGLGVLAANGIGVEEYWAAVLSGESGLAEITRFDPAGYSAKLAGQVDADFSALPNRLMPQTDHMTRLALLAAAEAFEDADVDPHQLPEYAAGVITGASAGGFEFGQRELEALWSKGGEYVSAYQSFAWFYPVNSGQISIRHALRGASGTVVAEQAGGLDALGKARRNIRTGTDLMVAGAVDGSLCPWGWLCQIRSGRLTDATDPAAAFLPFDRRAAGHVPGEGGALLIMEHPEHVARRGVDPVHEVHGVLAGHSATFDPAPGSDAPSGLRRAIEQALRDAGISPREVDVVFADGAGVPHLDAAEATAIAEVFGPRGVPVTVPKTMTGRLLAGGGPLDVATALLSIRDGVIPPTVNIERPAGHPIDLVRDTPRETPLTTALVLARGHGGFNSAVVVRRAA
ncbi:ketosynthase chain-length factor [Actinokineospora enzanensis]|uniref:ketosynthase chain-length factor n=1 Tax=Actinokineospora enzanensis TaxID=155975 RepID=UPI00039AAC15|nr:ketosynthase chain-length factor [Actinokineospora enzanensis]